MDLDALFQLVETLSERISENGSTIQQSEALTRITLVDPLLRELGWDTADLAIVISEYKSSRGSADYALIGDGKPAMIIEAKRLNTRLQDAVAQAINYCTLEGIDYFAVTDGRHWEIYETHRRGDLDEKRITKFDIMQGSAEVCLRALALWRRSVCAGSVRSGQTPIVEAAQLSIGDPFNPQPIALQPEPQPSTDVAEPISQTSDTHFDTDGWIPLSELHAKSGDRPAEIRFPDNSRINIRNWASVPTETARWLIGNGMLDGSYCPIQLENHYILALTPVNPNGEPFKRSREVSSLHVNTSFRRVGLIRNAIIIINFVGQDPSQFKIRLPS